MKQIQLFLFTLIILFMNENIQAYHPEALNRLINGDRNLYGVDLSDADLSHQIFQNIVLTGADLRGANLKFADLSGAQLNLANFEGADLENARLNLMKLFLQFQH